MPETPPRRSFWKRRLGDPVLAMLTQGVTPDKIAATLAVGTAASVFPFLGLTTLLNLGLGLWFRMNQPLLQALNYLLTPLHLVMILVYVRLGERIWGAEEVPFSVRDLFTTFHDAPFSEFVQRFGWMGVHAFTAWLLTAPVIVAALYFSLRPLMRQLEHLRARKPA